MDIYVIFSATPNKIGRFIRIFTAESYNHVSIALEQDLQQMYSFGRRNYYTPFWGGFVKETLSRYHIKNQSAQVRICRLPVSDEQYRHLKETLVQMEAQQDKLLYNHLSAMIYPVRWKFKVKDAYTCVEFCTQILQELGFIDKEKGFYSMEDLIKALEPYQIYKGAMPENAQMDTEYFQMQPVMKTLHLTARDFLRLFGRFK
ncbi:MAG: hypothetical protein IKJ94_04170 [Oscillospiraceae bacterium]|nr:hypothetical protein [Oscillospiraceae bacterium]